MTRWHEDDLAGRLLEKEGDKWEVIKIPAECEDPATDPLGRKLGEMLWKEWFTPEMFAEAKSSPRMWASLYQQRPAPEEGAFFERSWLKYYDSIPDNLQYYGASDYAVSADKGDYTVHVIAGFDKNDNLYIIDMWRGQTESSIWMDELVKMMRVYRPREWGEENGVILKSLDPFIKHTMNKERIYTTRRRQFTPTSDKVSRARTFQGLMQLGKVWLPRRSDWLRDLEYEILTFPSSKHDDQVDALSTLCQLLDTMKPNYGKRTTEHYDLGKDFSL
jgi:predicted phage terminase large subunit-like protein